MWQDKFCDRLESLMITLYTPLSSIYGLLLPFQLPSILYISFCCVYSPLSSSMLFLIFHDNFSFTITFYFMFTILLYFYYTLSIFILFFIFICCFVVYNNLLLYIYIFIFMFCSFLFLFYYTFPLQLLFTLYALLSSMFILLFSFCVLSSFLTIILHYNYLLLDTYVYIFHILPFLLQFF